MKHPYEALKGEYAELLATMRITREKEVNEWADRLNKNADRYLEIQRETGAPAAMLAGFHMRESGANFARNLANGDPLTEPTRQVPKGRPPLGQPPNDRFPVSFEFSAIDVVHYQHLDDNTAPYDLTYACWKTEAMNGFGYRDHGYVSPYPWAGTQHYDSGPAVKYDSDGHLNTNMRDRQLGVIPVMARLMQINPKLAFDKLPQIVPGPTPKPQPAPDGASPSSYDTKWLQMMLNRLAVMNAFKAPDIMPLQVDGSYGWKTREAVRAFQKALNITVDGLTGPETIKTIKQALIGEASPKPLPDKGKLADRIIRALIARGDELYTTGAVNNVYVEGMDADGRDNGNRPNQFNDTNFLIAVVDKQPTIVWSAEATDEPGKYWTDRPMNPGGAARIALGQHDAWSPGQYHGVDAWTQDKPVSFYRDAMKHFRREGVVESAIIGLHQHQGYDLPADDLGRSSAGCLVRRMRRDHLKFMELTRAGGRARLRTHVIEAARVLAEGAS